MSIEKNVWNRLQQEADEDEQEPVTGVAHAEGEEQQEEDGDEGRGVETVVGRAAVHVGQDLEHLHELVVAEADGRVVVHLCVVLEVEHAGFLYSLGDSFFVLRGCVAHERDDGVLRGGHGGLLGQVEVQLGELVAAFRLELGLALLRGQEDRLLVVDFGLDFGDFLLDGLVTAARAADAVGKGVGTGYDEPDLAIVFFHDLDGFILHPERVEGLGGTDVELDRNAGVGELFQQLRIESAPRLRGGGLFLEGLHPLAEFFQRIQRRGSGVGEVTFDRDGLERFREEDLPEGLDEVLPLLYGAEQVAGRTVHRFHAAGDIDKTDFLEFLQESFLLTVQQDEGVFGHRTDHTSEASSSSAAWRCLTIFWEALERFSSSSMYRLILRIASW